MEVDIISDDFIDVSKYVKSVTVKSHIELYNAPLALFGIIWDNNIKIEWNSVDNGDISFNICVLNEKYVYVNMILNRNINYSPSIFINNRKYIPLYTYHNTTNNYLTYISPAAAVLTGCVVNNVNNMESLYKFVDCKFGVKVVECEKEIFNKGDMLSVMYIMEEDERERIEYIESESDEIEIDVNFIDKEEEILDGDMLIDQVTRNNRLFEWAKPIVDNVFEENNRVILVAPTGEGKTRIGLYAMELAMLANDVGDKPVIKEVILFVAPYTIPIQQVSTKAMRMQGTRRPLLARAMWSTVVGGNKITPFYKKPVARALSGREPHFDIPYLETDDNNSNENQDVILVNPHKGVNSKKKLEAEVFICTTEMANIMLKDDKIKEYLKNKRVTVVFDEVQECFDTNSSRFPSHAEFLDLTVNYNFIGLTGTYGMCASGGNRIALDALGIKTAVFPRVMRAVCDVSRNSDIRYVINDIKKAITRYAKEKRVLYMEGNRDLQESMINILSKAPQVIALMNIVFDTSRGSAALFINYKNDLEYIRNNFIFLVWAFQVATIENGEICKYPRMFPLDYIPRRINDNGDIYSLAEAIRIEKEYEDKKAGAQARKEYENSFDYRETYGSAAYYKFLNKRIPTAVELREIENNKGYKSHSLLNKKNIGRAVALRIKYRRIDILNDVDNIESVDIEFEEQSQRLCDCLGVLRATRDSDDIDQLIMEFQKSHNHPALWLCTQKMGVGADLPDLRLLVIGKSRQPITQTLLDQIMGRVDRERNSYMVYNELGKKDIIDNTDLDRADISEVYSFLEGCSNDFNNIIIDDYNGEMCVREVFNNLINKKISDSQTIISPEAQVSIINGYKCLKDEMDEYLECEEKNIMYRWKNSIMYNIMNIIRMFLSTTAEGYEYGCAASRLIDDVGYGRFSDAQRVSRTYSELEKVLSIMRKKAKLSTYFNESFILNKKADAFADAASRITLLMVTMSRAIIIYKESKMMENMNSKLYGLAEATAKYLYIALLSAVNAKIPSFLSLPQLYRLNNSNKDDIKEDIIRKIEDIRCSDIDNKEEMLCLLEDELNSINNGEIDRYIAISDKTLPSYIEINNYIKNKNVIDELYKFGIEFKLERMCPYGMLPKLSKDCIDMRRSFKNMINNMISSVGILGDNIVVMPQKDDDPVLQSIDLLVKERVVIENNKYVKKKCMRYDVRSRCLDIDKYKEMVDNYVSNMTNDESFLAAAIILSILRGDHPKMRAQYEDIMRIAEDNYAITSLTRNCVNKSCTSQDSANGTLNKGDDEDDDILLDKLYEVVDKLNNINIDDNSFALEIYEKVIMMMYPAVFASIDMKVKKGISLPRCIMGIDLIGELGVLKKSVAALSAIQDMPAKERYKRLQAGGITSGSNDDSVGIKVLMDCESVRKYYKYISDNGVDINDFVNQLLFPLYLLIKISDKVGSGYGTKIDKTNILLNKEAAVNTFTTMCEKIGGENANRLVADYAVALAVPRWKDINEGITGVKDIEEKDMINLLTGHISPNTDDIPQRFIKKLSHVNEEDLDKARHQADNCLSHIIESINRKEGIISNSNDISNSTDYTFFL